MKKKFTLSIGIPAFNEEGNIGFLLDDLEKQKIKTFKIQNIIISSDASTDRTEEIVLSYKSGKIILLVNKKRSGVGMCENKIFKTADSDVLILLNADTRIFDALFLEKIVSEMREKNADLLAPSLREIEPKSFFEKILMTSMKFKVFMFENFKKGSNVYTCHGQARAFSKNLYKKLIFPSSIGEDAYSFFYCMKNGFKYSYAKNIFAYYKLPDSYEDHKKQSIRFFQSKKLLSRIFGKDYINNQYAFPKFLIIKSFLMFLIREPVNLILYAFVIIYLKIKSFSSKKIKETWDISKSSKKIILSK